jgi:hypothetical protein
LIEADLDFSGFDGRWVRVADVRGRDVNARDAFVVRLQDVEGVFNFRGCAQVQEPVLLTPLELKLSIESELVALPVHSFSLIVDYLVDLITLFFFPKNCNIFKNCSLKKGADSSV